MDEEKLITLVQSHECLYDMGNKDYSNNLKKDKFWTEIGNELQQSGN